MGNTFGIKLGIIGTGSIVEKIIAAIKEEPRIKVSAIYSRSKERAEEFASRHNILHSFTSMDDMASSNVIDAVYIASPNSFHALHSILFMRNGKHVLCEKPLASNAFEVKQMIDASRLYNVTLMEAMKSTLTPSFIEVRRRLKDIGKIRQYFACYCQYSSRYDKLKEGVVLNAFKSELSNGAVMDIGIYTIYPMVVLLGKPKKIDAIGLKLSTGVDGQGVVNFEYDGILATVMYSKVANSYLPSEIQGEGGTIKLNRINAISSVEVELQGCEEKEVIRKEDVGRRVDDGEYCYELSEFVNLIELGNIESEINSHKNSLITMEIIDEIRKQVGVVYPTDIVNCS